MKINNSQRITAIVGSGASIDLDGITTDAMTKEILGHSFDYYDIKTRNRLSTGIISYINSVLQDNQYPSNFETIFHVLEEMYSYTTGWSNPLNKTIVPAFSYFTAPNYCKYNDSSLIEQVSIQFLQVIADRIIAYSEQYSSHWHNPENEWHCKFWNAYKGLMDVFTLNYDDLIETSLHGEYEDGFQEIDKLLDIECKDFKGFNPKKLLESKDKTTINHLHGSIHYGNIPNEFLNKAVYKYLHGDLFYWCDYRYIPDSSKSHFTAQNGQQMLCNRIITGLSKLEHINRLPYSTYFGYLSKKMIENSKLLIVGYSFCDLYINNLIQQMNLNHNNDQKIVIIDYWGKDLEEQKNRINNESDNYMGAEAVECILRLSMDGSEKEKGIQYIKNQLEQRTDKNKPYESENGKCLIFTNGFKNAVLSHGEMIKEFLS